MSHRNLTRIGVVSAAVAALGSGDRRQLSATQGGTAAIDPHNFVRYDHEPVPALSAGERVCLLRASRTAQSQRDVVRVTHRTRKIVGVT